MGTPDSFLMHVLVGIIPRRSLDEQAAARTAAEAAARAARAELASTRAQLEDAEARSAAATELAERELDRARAEARAARQAAAELEVQVRGYAQRMRTPMPLHFSGVCLHWWSGN